MGLCKGEVIGLLWSAVNLDRAELDIGWQLQRVLPPAAPPGNQDRGLGGHLADAGHLRDGVADPRERPGRREGCGGRLLGTERADVHDPGRYAIRAAEPEPSFRDAASRRAFAAL